MNFDTRTILDIISLDAALAKDLEDLIVDEKKIYKKTGKSSNNNFVTSIIPLIKSELKIRVLTALEQLKLASISKYIDYEKVDYYQLIPALAKI